jgi:hypothetical protein
MDHDNGAHPIMHKPEAQQKLRGFSSRGRRYIPITKQVSIEIPLNNKPVMPFLGEKNY